MPVSCDLVELGANNECAIIGLKHTYKQEIYRKKKVLREKKDATDQFPPIFFQQGNNK